MNAANLATLKRWQNAGLVWTIVATLIGIVLQLGAYFATRTGDK